MICRVGDVIDAFMAMMVYRSCTKVEGGLPADVKSKMMFKRHSKKLAKEPAQGTLSCVGCVCVTALIFAQRAQRADV